MPAIWRNGDKAIVTNPTTDLTAGTVIGTTQRDGYYDVHIEDQDGIPATYRNGGLERPDFIPSDRAQ